MKKPEALKLLAIFPHPDDESLGMGGTLAKYSAEGVETYLITATRGQRGWPMEDQPHPGFDVLGSIRERELRCAAEQLDLHELILLDYMDGDVDLADPQEIIGRLTAQIRRIRPQVVVTFAPDGGYGHPDHIALAQFTAAALVCSADASYSDPDHMNSHRVSKFYHMVDQKAVVDLIVDTIGGVNMDVDGGKRSMIGWEEWAVTTCIDVAAYFDTTWKAILCHATQLPGFGAMTELPRDRLLDIWSKGTFVRIFSLVNGGRKKENDLFDGLGP